MSYEEEDTCVSYEEEDTCVSKRDLVGTNEAYISLMRKSTRDLAIFDC